MPAGKAATPPLLHDAELSLTMLASRDMTPVLYRPPPDPDPPRLQ